MVSPAFLEMLGSSLVGRHGNVSTTQALAEKKAVALYFSAHWCPPCRGFTPKLAEWYSKSLQQKGLEVIFVSSDQTEADFKSYFGEMPWLALPFSERQTKEKLSSKFKVRGIPSLVILDGETAETITTEGRAKVSEDPLGADFPWRPKPFAELIGDSFLRNAKGETVGRDALKGKVVGLYFSAHWCPPCRGFTPKLAETYKKFQAKGLPFEIIFASSDQSEDEFKAYFGNMPWLALPFGDKRKQQWSSMFDVSGIPSLVILDKDFNTITKDGRASIMEDPQGDAFPWHPKPPAPVLDLAAPRGIEAQPSLVVFMADASKREQESVIAELLPVATSHRDVAWGKKQDPKYLFFAAKDNKGAVPRVSELVAPGALKKSGGTRCSCFPTMNRKGPVAPPKVVLLNLNDNGAFYDFEGKVTTASVEKFLADFEAGKLERKQCAE